MDKHERKRQKKRATRKGKRTSVHREGMSRRSNKRNLVNPVSFGDIMSLPGITSLLRRKKVEVKADDNKTDESV